VEYTCALHSKGNLSRFGSKQSLRWLGQHDLVAGLAHPSTIDSSGEQRASAALGERDVLIGSQATA